MYCTCIYTYAHITYLHVYAYVVELCQYSVIIYISYNITGGDDYGSGPYNVTFAVGSTRVSYNITIIDDSVLEDNEMFSISIISITNGHIVGTPALATVTIIDTTSKILPCGIVCIYHCKAATYVCKIQ